MKMVRGSSLQSYRANDLYQLSRAAIERNEDRRAAFRYTFGLTCDADKTVFVDESSFDRRTSLRRKGWAPTGRRAERHHFFVRGRR